jgi:GTP:adenosylcobinamide-phosphate guanylyltransferase
MSASLPSVTVLLPAGRRPGATDPLASARGLLFKAHVAVSGEAMLSRVVKILLACPEVARIVILAQEPDALTAYDDCRWLASHEKIYLETSTGSISASVHSLLTSGRVTYPAVLTTSDHVLLTPDMFRHFIAQASAAQTDVAIAMVERQTLLKAYAGNQRTWLKFTDGWWSGANLFGFFSPRVLPALELWQTIEQDQKKGWKIVAAFGPWLLLRVLLKSISLRNGLAKAGARLGLAASLVDMPMAEACIDVDKESDLVLAEKILAARS